jgi:hypothetical protein
LNLLELGERRRLERPASQPSRSRAYGSTSNTVVPFDEVLGRLRRRSWYSRSRQSPKAKESRRALRREERIHFGINRRTVRWILGNPLIATAIRLDITAGLFAPVEVLVTEKGNRSGHDNDLRAPIVSDGHRRTPRYAKPPKEVVDTFGSVQRDERCPHFRFHRCFRRRACPSCITSIVIGSPLSFQQTPVTHGDGKSTFSTSGQAIRNVQNVFELAAILSKSARASSRPTARYDALSPMERRILGSRSAAKKEPNGLFSKWQSHN